MFHSSSSRHEQYIVRSSSYVKATLNKKRSSLESEVSGADSGYTSSSSTPSSVGSPTTDININHVTPRKNQTKDDFTNMTKDTLNNIDTPIVVKKKKSKRHQPPRQPDLVYSCPRPLAFPFHNDDHFLPIAEADPRDVARVSPSLNRSSSLQSSKTSVGSTRMYDNYQYSGINSTRGLDTESSYSHQSSILSTIQRGTVRSIRSLFQLPDSLSNRDGLSRSQTNNTTHTQYSSNTRHTCDTNSTSTINPPLERLEIKKGTVQSIKDMFSRKRSSIQAQRVPQPVLSKQQKGLVGATIGQFESSSNLNYSRVNVNAATSISSNQKKSQPSTSFKPVAVNVTKSESRPFTSRAAEFASRALWKPKSNPIRGDSSSPATKPLPKKPAEPAPTRSLKKEVKKLSARMFTLPRTWRDNDEGDVSLPVSTSDETPSVTKQKRSIFSFKRSDISARVSNTKKSTTTSEEANDAPPPSTTTVGKMWKSFKSLVSGKKSSRVGIL